MTSGPAEKREPHPVGQPRASDLDLNALLDHPTELLDIFFDRLPMGIAIFDRELVLRRCNPTWAGFVARYTETPGDEVLPGRYFFDLATSIGEASTAEACSVTLIDEASDALSMAGSYGLPDGLGEALEAS